MNFIEIYDDALTKEQCEIIINEFESNTDKQIIGKSGNGKVKPDVKKSIEIGYNIADDSKTTKIISYSLIEYVKRYREKYPDVDRLLEWKFFEYYNIQKYKPKDGYFKPHCEVSGRNDNSLNRLLVWMYYLNDMDNGGTKFTSYNMTVQAKRGRLVLWPAYWTHTHCGVISNIQTKYIATGWFVFNNNQSKLISLTAG